MIDPQDISWTLANKYYRRLLQKLLTFSKSQSKKIRKNIKLFNFDQLKFMSLLLKLVINICHFWQLCVSIDINNRTSQMIEQLSGKLICGSIHRKQLPKRLHEFTANLIQQEYEKMVQSSKGKQAKKQIFSKIYVQFKHKKNSQQNFKIFLNNFKQPSSLIHLFKMQNEQFELLPKINRKCNMQVIRESNKQQQLEQKFNEDSSDEQPIDLILEDYEEKDSYSKQPSVEMNSSQLKGLVIQLIKSTPEGINSARQVRQRLQRDHKRKFSEKSIKNILQQVCDTNPQKRSKSFILKQIYQSNQYFDASYGAKARKRNKNDNDDD